MSKHMNGQSVWGIISALVLLCLPALALAQANPVPAPIGIKAGSGITLGSDGTLSNSQPYSSSQAQADNAAAIAAAQSAATAAAITGAPVQSVNGATGAVSVAVPTNAQIVAAVSSGLTSLANPNIAMPNGGHLAHPIYIGAYPTPLVLTGTSSQSVFSATGAGSLTMAAGVLNYLGAQFELDDAGYASTGLANVATETANITLGGVTLASQATLALPVNVVTIPFVSRIICTVMATGTSGKVGCHGSLRFGAGLASVAPFETFLLPTTPVTVDLTQALAWDARSTLSSTIGSPSITVLSAEIWQQN